MSKSYTFKLPLYIDIPRKTVADYKFRLNIGSYKRLKRYDVEYSKEIFRYIIKEQLDECPVFENNIKLRFKIYKEYRVTYTERNKNKFYAVISDYLISALKEENKIKSDKDDVVKLEQILPTNFKQKKKGELVKYATITITETE